MRESAKYLAGVIIILFVIALMPLSVDARLGAWIKDSIENYQGEAPVAEDEQVKNSSVINYDGDPGLSINAIRFLAYDDDKNWEIGDFELLGAIDDWALENLGDFDLLNIIDYWAVGGYCWDKASGLNKKGNETVCLLLVRSTSFSPVTASDGYGTDHELNWKYRVNNQTISISQNVEGIPMNINMHVSDIDLTINPNTLLRQSRFDGSISGNVEYQGSWPLSGDFDVFANETVSLSQGTTLVYDQDLDLDLTLSVAGDSLRVVFDVIIDYDSPVEWFLDRDDLSSLPIGYTYSERGTVYGWLSGTLKLYLGGWPNTVSLSERVTSAESWKIVDKQDSITVRGVEYYDIVKVERNTVVPDYYSSTRSRSMTITYWVAKGIGMVKGIGQYSFAGQPLIIELMETNLSQ